MCPVCGATFGSETAFCANDGVKLLDAAEASRVLADEDPLVRMLIGGRYRILKRLGEGGMGVVYLAEHEAIEKRVAIKVLKDQYAQREDVVARFQQEAKSASRVKHQGILEVFDFGRTEDGRFFLAMELLDGVDLAHVLEKEALCEPSRVVRLGVKMARALAAAHQKGVIHRDMKPENVFLRLGDDGLENVKIVDFGIAQLRAEGEEASDPNAKVVGRKLTKTGMIFGTPEYMSPEQAAGKRIDQRVDVYALGIILFEMLTGHTPFQGETFMGILSAHLMEPIPPLIERAPPGFYCSPELEAVVRRALAKDPDSRYRNMNEIAEAMLNTPEGAIVEQRLSMARSSQFPSGVAGTPGNIQGTDYRMLSQPPTGSFGVPPMPKVSFTPPPVPFAPSNSAAPPPGEGGSGLGTLTGFGHSGASAHEMGGATLYDTDTRARQSTSSGEAALSAATPTKKGSGGAALVVVLLLLVLGGGGYFAYRTFGAPDPSPGTEADNGGKSTKAPPVKSAKPDETKSAPSDTTPPPAVSSSAPEPVADAIKIQVEAAGLEVERQLDKDWVQVCDKTPCTVVAKKGEVVTLRTSKAGVHGVEKKILADKEQTVKLQAAITAAPPTTKSSTTDLCEVTLEEGIKVWRPCPKK